MKLILLYGPPAVGKLTIAKEIARLTGFKLFHGHLTVDLVASIFPIGTPLYRKLVWDIRYAVFAEAAQANIDGLIFTTGYGRDREQFIARCIEVVEPCGGEVCFVHVHCQAETLRLRVVREDRKQYGKITSVELLNETLRHGEPQALFEAGTLWESLSLNTDVLRPVEAAQQVIAHYRLPTQHHNLHFQDSEERTMDNRLAALLSIVPPKPDYDPVQRAIDDADTKPEVAAVLKQFASMPPSTGVLANPVRHQQTVTCANASLDLSIRSFTVRGMLMEEDIVRGAAGPLEVIFVGLFGRLATADQMILFSNYLAQAFASALVPDGRMPELARFITRFPEASPDIAMQHCASVRKAQRRSGEISRSRPPDALLAEMIAVHMENAVVGAGASYMRSLLRTSPQMTASAMVDGVDRFMADLHDKNPLHMCYSLVLRRAVHDTEARMLDRFGAMQVHHGSAGSNMVARYLASLHTRAVSDLFTAAQMTLDSARHFGAISDMSDFVRELERVPVSRRDDAIRERMRRGDLPTFGHPEIAAAGRSNTVECDPRPALYLEPLFDAIDAGEVEIPDDRKERFRLVQRMYQIALVEGLTKPGTSGQLRVAPNTDFGAWLVQEALGIEEPDRTLLSYVYRGFGWMMDVREQLQQPIIRPVVAPDPHIVPGPATDALIPTVVTAVHDRLCSGEAFLRSGETRVRVA